MATKKRPATKTKASTKKRTGTKTKADRVSEAAKAVANAVAKSKAKTRRAGGKSSALDSAAKVLGESKEPLTTKQMVETMAAKGYWKSKAGKTPDRTLYSAILREIVTKKRDARFAKAARGKFVLKG